MLTISDDYNIAKMHILMEVKESVPFDLVVGINCQ